jgi:hypothetical protein
LNRHRDRTPGTVLAGASLTAVMMIMRFAVTLAAVPLSVTWKLIWRLAGAGLSLPFW